eukprot:7389142-Prymnesium_polylepis.2
MICHTFGCRCCLALRLGRGGPTLLVLYARGSVHDEVRRREEAALQSPSLRAFLAICAFADVFAERIADIAWRFARHPERRELSTSTRNGTDVFLADKVENVQVARSCCLGDDHVLHDAPRPWHGCPSSCDRPFQRFELTGASCIAVEEATFGCAEP